MKKSLLVVMVVGFTAVLGAAALYAGTSPPDVIKLQDSNLYPKPKMGPVTFSHKKHATDYKIPCGQCHHDKNGKPLTNLKPGDNVQPCYACHNKPGERPKGPNAPKLTEKEAMQYHADAMHKRCIGCHREYDQKNSSHAAPTTCMKCHAKKANAG